MGWRGPREEVERTGLVGVEPGVEPAVERGEVELVFSERGCLAGLETGFFRTAFFFSGSGLAAAAAAAAGGVSGERSEPY